MAYTTINKGSDYFNTITWTGDDNSPRSFTGVGFQPDLVWGKNKDDGASPHHLTDVVRGVGITVSTNTTGAEITNSAFGYITSFDSDGFTAQSGSTNIARFNSNTQTYVAWNWLAGGTASSNSDGSITSNVSVNTTSGFSIVSYTGSGSSPSTVGHGLGEVPKMIILKNTSVSVDWQVYHQSLGNDNKILLSSNAASSATSNWNNTSPTSSFFTINGTSSGAPDASGENFIAYCFAEKKGFSKFGSYTGNGRTDGTFVYTGFKPAWVMTKITSSTDSWVIYDNKRNTFNPEDKYLLADTSGAEATFTQYDFVSNGFKFRTSGSQNTSGATFIYMAFAENPFVTSTRIPATAR